MCEINYERILASYGSRNAKVNVPNMLKELQEVPLVSVQRQELKLLAKKRQIVKHERLYIFRLYFDTVLNTK